MIVNMKILVTVYLTLITVCGESSWKPTTAEQNTTNTTLTTSSTTTSNKQTSTATKKYENNKISTTVTDTKPSLKQAPTTAAATTTELRRKSVKTGETTTSSATQQTTDDSNIKLWIPNNTTSNRQTQSENTNTGNGGIGISLNDEHIPENNDHASDDDNKDDDNKDDKTNNQDDDDDDDGGANSNAPQTRSEISSSNPARKKSSRTPSIQTSPRKTTTQLNTSTHITSPKERGDKTRKNRQTSSNTENLTTPTPSSSKQSATSGTNRATTTKVTVSSSSKKKTKPRRIRKKKKISANSSRPEVQGHTGDTPQPMPMLMSPAGRQDAAKKKKRANKKGASRLQGARGPKGEKGDKGERGPPGPAANTTEDLPQVKLQAASTAVLTDHFGPDKNVIIPFDLKLIDLADNYDNTSGVFMTSIPGIYVISLYLMSHPGAKVNARIFINNRPVAALWADDSKNAGFYPSSSIQTISKLAFGDQVYVMLVDGGYGESWVHANYNAFTVYLLYEEMFF